MDLRGTVETCRPFTSVKEAVAIFGEIYSPKPFSVKKSDEKFVDIIKKLETELEETKAELKLLKERETQTEVALATLNAELHKNMSKLAQVEATAAGKAASATKTVRFQLSQSQPQPQPQPQPNINNQTLSHILSASLGENDHLFRGNSKKHKHKPIIPLVGDLFFKRKSPSATSHHNPLYASHF